MSNQISIRVNGVDLLALCDQLKEFSHVLTAQSEKPKAEKEKLLTRFEVSILLGVTLVTVHEWTKKGILTAYRIGTRVRYKESEIMQKLTNNQTNKR